MFQKIKLLSFGFSLLFIQAAFAQNVPAKPSGIVKAPITVESIWKNYEFSSRGFAGFKGMKDGEHFTKVNQTKTSFSITKQKYMQHDGVGEVLLTNSDLMFEGRKISIDDYDFNQQEDKILITSEMQSVYRRSYVANFFIFDLKTKKISALDSKRLGSTLAEFSPDGTKVAYVFENNMYVKDLASNKITAITTDGLSNSIINGTTDWVYEEEFAITKGFSWSFDSKNIAFLRFDESAVKEFQLEYYGNLYPDIYTYKYPKAGKDNSKVTTHIYNLTTKKKSKLDLGSYEYIPRFKWSGSANQLVVQTLNRHQNHVQYHLFDWTQKKMTSKVIFEEKSDTYVEIDDNLLILKDGKTILRTSEMDGHMHIYEVGFDGSNKQVTKGNWDVIEFLGIDESSQTIYYTSAEKGAIYQGIYSIQIDGSNKKAISEETGYNAAEFAQGMTYFVKRSSTANTPTVTSLCYKTGEVVAVLEDNQTLNEKLSVYDLTTKEFITIKGATEDLNAWIMKPKNFDASKKYPVYMTIYGGPGSNTVKDAFGGNDYMYHQLLTQRGYIVISVDPRGTMYRGTKFKKSTYLQLGKLETEDFIAVAKELGKMDFIDKNRIGIQGWSYGGYMSSLAMTKGADYFKMGIAVAPVTNWRYYDNIYTERFMRTPQENAAGYDDNSPINFVKNIKGNYFLIHGSADDNVHNQNAMEMVNALVKSNVQFDLFIYPNRDHGIYGGNTRNHLFNMLLDYTLKNL
ncbi:MAG: S9 family peptidase [Crocinitomicaceae bacterium]|nr:S9 family peptidase [Crocinitomicaceae bacterium]